MIIPIESIKCSVGEALVSVQAALVLAHRSLSLAHKALVPELEDTTDDQASLLTGFVTSIRVDLTSVLSDISAHWFPASS